MPNHPHWALSIPTQKTQMSKESRKKNIKEMLKDPMLKKKLIEGAVDFICKVEGIRS